ncbi:nuclear transport factor 2 [Pisolithus orientalis]|uniref:nuclear transport factor 2 n=1 Tax=Pisolithus orientalis TaxID=936130 RepID=UPI0022256903|nr:nuclear transport factor 2 [Pisolithus orientalis]KAI6009381.1 nuclear transport factor 2 [Pisolithus orientalis]
MDVNAIAKNFTDFYYQTFDADRSRLAPLYRPESMLTWEGQQILGVSAITEKLTSLPFSKVQHRVTTVDAQPSVPATANLIVSVTGLLLVDDSVNPMPYTQAFHLVSSDNSYYVYNDIFRLNLG